MCKLAVCDGENPKVVPVLMCLMLNVVFALVAGKCLGAFCGHGGLRLRAP